jgi:predicted transposase YdaD
MPDQKNTSRVVSPHDKVFKTAYSDLENARSLLSDRLPDKVLKLVDLNALEISKDNFIEKELAGYYSDLLYKVNMTDGNRGFIYVLFEHKSYYDRFVHLQLLEYKEIAEQAISKETGEYVMSLLEKTKNEGRLEGEVKGEAKGLKEGIELGITLVFPGDIDTVMAEVNKVEDLDTLKEIKETIKTAKDVSEIMALLK